MNSEHTPTPGATWETELVRLGEVVVDIDRDESPSGWSEPDTPTPGFNGSMPSPQNRQARRAAERAARRNPK